MSRLIKFLSIFLVVATLSGAARAQDAETGNYYDPLEPMNRAIFSFNNYVDIFVLDPVTDGYRFIVPEEGRGVIQNFLRNLREPFNILNNLLQGDLDGAYNSAFRMTVNSFAGFGGLLDVAGSEGYFYEFEDLGQTLGYWGISDGPYLVIPFIGPASSRNALGTFAEGYADPFNRWSFNTDEEHQSYTRLAFEVLTAKDEVIDLQRDLRENSADYYAAVRSIVYQRNQSLLHEDIETSEDIADFPEYDDF